MLASTLNPNSMAFNRVSEIVFLTRPIERLILICNSKERRYGRVKFNEQGGTKKWKWSHFAWSEGSTEVASK